MLTAMACELVCVCMGEGRIKKKIKWEWEVRAMCLYATKCSRYFLHYISSLINICPVLLLYPQGSVWQHFSFTLSLTCGGGSSQGWGRLWCDGVLALSGESRGPKDRQRYFHVKKKFFANMVLTVMVPGPSQGSVSNKMYCPCKHTNTHTLLNCYPLWIL